MVARNPGILSLKGELAFVRSSAKGYLWKSSTCRQLQPSQHLSNLNTSEKASLFLFGEEEKGVSIKKIELESFGNENGCKPVPLICDAKN